MWRWGKSERETELPERMKGAQEYECEERKWKEKTKKKKAKYEDPWKVSHDMKLCEKRKDLLLIKENVSKWIKK